MPSDEERNPNQPCTFCGNLKCNALNPQECQSSLEAERDHQEREEQEYQEEMKRIYEGS